MEKHSVFLGFVLASSMLSDEPNQALTCGGVTG